MSSLAVEIPDKLAGLFEPHRYKVAHGGRGSAKSWSFAAALLTQSIEQPLRVGCFREVQKSIRDSVHKLLGDQITRMGANYLFDVQQSVVKGANGSEFLFAGLQDHTVDSIKSYEGLDRAWIEEAQTVSKRSWDILVPTIRKDGSEIWVSMNPELDTDESYQRFVENPPPDTFCVQMNWRDNPWFSTVLEAERKHAQATMPAAEYANIWEGKCKPAVTGAIYAAEIAETQDKRLRPVPYDPALKVFPVFDLGWNDKTAIILAQKEASALRVIEYVEDSHKTLDWYSAELRKRNYNWGTLYLPHDGAHASLQTGKSAKQVMESLGWSVELVPNMKVEEGIRLARMALPRCYFDKDATARLIQCLRRYRRGIPSTTGEPGAPVHDEWSHGADAFRYLAVVADRLSNEDFGAPLTYPNMRLA